MKSQSHSSSGKLVIERRCSASGTMELRVLITRLSAASKTSMDLHPAIGGITSVRCWKSIDELTRGAGFLPDDLTNRALRFISSEDDRPFFLMMTLQYSALSMQV